MVLYIRKKRNEKYHNTNGAGKSHAEGEKVRNVVWRSFIHESKDSRDSNYISSILP